MTVKAFLIVACFFLASHARSETAPAQAIGTTPDLYTVRYYVSPAALSQEIARLHLVAARPNQGAIFDLAAANGINLPPGASASYYKENYESGITVRNTKENIARLDALLNSRFKGNWWKLQ